MTGLNKITAQILAEAKAQAEEIVKAAQAEENSILSAADAEIEKTVADIEKKSAADVENMKARVQSANDLYRRTQLLAVKQNVISQVIEKAYNKVCGLDKEAYFGMLQKMIEKHALAKDGVISFSAKDLADMPAGFEQKIAEAAKAAGGTLTLDKEAKNIENGFLLIYDGIEENCTLKAIFDAKHDEMQDTVYELLYRKEA